MSAMLPFYFFCSSLLSLACSQDAPSGYMRREYSIIKPYSGSLQYWELLGSALTTNEQVRLTPDEPSKRGGVWNILPCYIRDWEVHIHFKVHGHGTRLFGDGFAFWYARDKSKIGPVFGSTDLFSGLGLMFDTYANQNGEQAHEHPYISAQVNNGTLQYDHDRDGVHGEAAGCTSYFRGTGSDTSVAIRYLGNEKRLTVQYSIEGEDQWRDCFDMYGVELPTGYYFGLSAATGDLSDNHDIIYMKLYELESNERVQSDVDYSKIVPRASSGEPERGRADDVPGSFSTGTQKALGVLHFLAFAAVVVAIIGYFVYQRQQAASLKRFY